MATPSGRKTSVVDVTKRISKFSDSTIINRIGKTVSSQWIPTASKIGTNLKNNYRESVSSINPTQPRKKTINLVQMLTQTTPVSSKYISSVTGDSEKKVSTQRQSNNYNTTTINTSSPLES